MAGKQQQDASQYKYEEMSGKVTRADRRLLDVPQSRKDREVSSNPESLANKISMKDMGSRLHASKEERERSAMAKQELRTERRSTPRAEIRQAQLSDLEALNYVPRTLETEQIYILLYSWCSIQMDSDVPQNVVASLTDLVLEILKDETIIDNEKKSRVEQALEHPLSIDEFQKLMSLSKQITDYDKEDVEFSGEHEIAIAVEDEDEEDEEQSDNNEEMNEDLLIGEGIGKLTDDEDDQVISNEDKIAFESSKGDTNSDKGDELLLRSIDQYYLRRLIATCFNSDDAVKNSQKAEVLFKLIEKTIQEESGIRSLENELMEFFEFEHSDQVEFIIKQHAKIYYGILLSQKHTEKEKLDVHVEMKTKGYQSLVDEDTIGLGASSTSNKRKLEDDSEVDTKKPKLNQEPLAREPKFVDLESMVFEQGSHLRTSTTIQLPEGAYKLPKKHEEYHIPAPEPPKFADGERLIPIDELPDWVQPVFPNAEMSTLNRIQSKVYPTAFNSDENILMCAPTGAGKTNVAMLTVLRTLSKYRNENGTLDLDNFKIVYIAPLKALVQEQVREFQRRLEQFGISVSELTGDSNLTKLQISSTQILVTTPEKWDVITRKMSDISYVNLVRLVIIDEVHLLHDERGPVLESIVARTLRSVDLDDNEPVRLIGLSATLPNYKDVATFLRVDEKKGLFYFDSSYRPCPLEQQFVGINEKNAFKRQQSMNEVCYEKVLESINKGHQVIVFVHSRKETAKTAQWIKDKMLENEQLNKLVGSDLGSTEILREESEACKSNLLKNLLPTGFAIHHAGLSQEDRSRSEGLFASGNVKVLVCTATLAWGVNLPAHTVIIKGTNVYSPEKGTWVELSPQDILQMLGRAGRPRYDKSGEGIIITSKDEVKYYLAILNQQLPIESQLVSKLIDNINAEVVLGSVKSLKDVVSWLAYTYLYVRMMRSPKIYHVGIEYESDKNLTNKRMDLAHSALTILNKSKLVNYDTTTGEVTATDLGRIASYYYISHESMALYHSQLKSHSSPLDILRIFSQSGEFKYLPVRNEEKPEISKLLEISPIPIRESSEDPLAKINVLLQAYISRYHLDGFALLADMIYITQSAGRLIRALHEIALIKGWSLLAKVTLDFCKMIDRRMWLPNSPFRQFPGVPFEIIRKTEGSQLPWSHYLNLTDAAEMSQAIRSEKLGRTALELVQKFPKLTINSSCQPITSTLVRVELEILPEWVWDTAIHGFAESFLLLVEDCDGSKILHTDSLLVRKGYINEEHLIDFTVPVLSPVQPNYFVSLISDKWINCEYRVPIMLNKIKIPKKFPAPTVLLNLQLVPVSDLHQTEFEESFEFENFNKFQTQAFNALYNTNESVFIGASKGSGKTVCAEIAIMNHWKQGNGRAVYITPHQVIVDGILKDWKKRFGHIGGGKEINKLVGDTSQDLKLLESSHLILATPGQFENISRRWKNRKSIQRIELLIADDAHLIGNGLEGCAYEVLIARMRFLSLQLETGLRIVALSTSLANGKDFAEWIGVSKNNIFNYSSSEKLNPLEVYIRSFSINHNPSLLLAMTKPAFNSAKVLADDDRKAIVFVPTRKHCVEIGADFIKHANTEGIEFLKAEISSLETYLLKVKDLKLREALTNGVGFFYRDMAASDKKIVENLFQLGALTVLFATSDTSSYCPTADIVVVLSTQTYEGREHRYINYPINQLLEMIGVARSEEGSAFVSILTNASSRDYYKKFINESLPLESHLNIFLHDALINEITTKVVTSRQSCIDWLTYTYFYKRLQLNPSFYGVRDTSHIGLSEYLSELVETTLKELEEAKLIEFEEEEDEEEEAEDEIVPQNGAMIAAHYHISFATMQTFTASLNSKTKLRGLMEIICAASEFENVPVRLHETPVLTKIYNRLPMKYSNVDYNSPHFKCFILLQAHFSRMSLPQDLAADQKFILEKVLNLLYAAIDILSTEGNLNAVTAMDLSQMVVQAVWNNDNPLKQVPHFDESLLLRCSKMNVETVYDIMSLEDEERDQLLSLGTKEVSKIAEFVNQYPNVDISYTLDLSEPIIANEDKSITINIERDEDVDDLTVVAPFYPVKKVESWWIAIGEPNTKQLYAIKKTSILKSSQKVKLDFSIPDKGIHQLAIWCICDSYVDADKEIHLEVEVLEEDAEEEASE